MIVSKVKEIMREKGVTYQELIKRTGISGDTVARCRSNRIKECSLGTLEAIAPGQGEYQFLKRPHRDHLKFQTTKFSKRLLVMENGVIHDQQ